MNTPQDIYDHFTKGGEEAIKSAADRRRQEGLLLDFKQANSPMERDDRKNLARALSGFGNSEGGVVVWGVDCRRDKDGIDAAYELSPIQGLQRFLSDLNDATAQSVSPPVIGIEHQIIPSSSNGDTGYAVTYVPKGQGEPHMAIAKDTRAFYCRSGTSFILMEPYMVADRYRRRPQPRLEVTYKLLGPYCPDPGHPGYMKYGVVVRILNTGVGIAVYPGITIYEDTGLAFTRTDYVLHRRRTQWAGEGRREVWAGGVDDVIHPGECIDVTELELIAPPGPYVAPPNLPEPAIRYDLYSEGYSEKDGKLIIPLDEIWKQAFTGG